MKIQNAIFSNILDRSQRYFAHVTTVTLSWRVQYIVVIGHVYFTLECFEFSSNFEFDRNMLSGTGARTSTTIVLMWAGRCMKGIPTWWFQFASQSRCPRYAVHDDEMKWKPFPLHWPFVRGIQQYKGKVMWSSDVFFDVSLDKRPNTESRGRWIKMYWSPFDVAVTTGYSNVKWAPIHLNSQCCWYAACGRHHHNGCTGPGSPTTILTPA